MNPRLIVLGDRDVSYLTHREIDATLALLPSELEAGWVRRMRSIPSCCSPRTASGSLPARHIATARRHTPQSSTRELSGTPFLGTCGGFQYVCVSLAAHSPVGRSGHAETNPDSSHIVVAPLACALYGEERPVTPVPGTRLAAICGSAPFAGFHFCGYGLTPDGEKLLAASRVTVSAHSADGGVEGIELTEHPFFMATLSSLKSAVRSPESCIHSYRRSWRPRWRAPRRVRRRRRGSRLRATCASLRSGRRVVLGVCGPQQDRDRILAQVFAQDLERGHVRRSSMIRIPIAAGLHSSPRLVEVLPLKPGRRGSRNLATHVAPSQAPIVGLRCPGGNSIACDRISVAAWVVGKPLRLTAMIAGVGSSCGRRPRAMGTGRARSGTRG